MVGIAKFIVGLLVVLGVSTVNAQKFYPLNEKIQSFGIGEAGSLEMYHMVDTKTRAELIVIYTWEPEERWVALRTSRIHLWNLYLLFDNAIRRHIDKEQVGLAIIQFEHRPFSPTKVTIKDEFGNHIQFKINRRQLRLLFGR